jgi:hypothetical protein
MGCRKTWAWEEGIATSAIENGWHPSCNMGGCTLGATGLEDFLALHELHKFNECFDPQRDLQLIAKAKRGFIEALHQQNCPLWVAPERFPH